MANRDYHIAQMNVALMRAPLDDPIMADFMNNLSRINALGDHAPGFVWRLQTEKGDATSLRVFDNEYLLINISVWEAIERLYEFTYRSQHADFFRRRREWFEKRDEPALVLWWIRAGDIPTTQEARERLEALQLYGPTPLAFTFKQRFHVEDMLQYQRQ